MHRSPITIVGAGLVGALLATLLSRSGREVRLIEKRPDPRQAGFLGGRSINLALAERGLNALRAAGLEGAVMKQAVMMRGRMIHDHDGHTNLQRYGVDDSEVIWSVSRGGLNMLLLDAAERAGAELHFDQALVDADFALGELELRHTDGTHRRIGAPITIGADGAGSAVRAAMSRVEALGERTDMLGHGYKELEIPPPAQFPDGQRPEAIDAEGRFAIEPHALHIWPRGGYMCIALPNDEGSFTVTLFLPNEGAAPSFATVTDADAAEALFREQFPDALPLIPALRADFDANPVGTLGTLYLDRWHLGGKALLIGDASHAIVPFHGQGMNAGFEDAAALAPMLADAEDADVEAVFAAFQAQRKPDTDAIAAMALENYIEMRDSVADPHYLLQRALGQQLAARAPTHFMPRYRMVTFTHLPYAYAFERGRAQRALLDQLLGARTSLDGLDLDAAERTLRATLPPLPALRG
jgi:kynurenine 3-monooxygenase